MHAFTQQQICTSLALRLKAIILSVETSLDKYDASSSASPVQQILAVRELLGTLRRERRRAEALSRIIPSPNLMNQTWAQEIAAAGTAVFRFVEKCREREDALVNILHTAPGALPQDSLVQ